MVGDQVEAAEGQQHLVDFLAELAVVGNRGRRAHAAGPVAMAAEAGAVAASGAAGSAVVEDEDSAPTAAICHTRRKVPRTTTN
jgi:hypothetical protein